MLEVKKMSPLFEKRKDFNFRNFGVNITPNAENMKSNYFKNKGEGDINELKKAIGCSNLLKRNIASRIKK